MSQLEPLLQFGDLIAFILLQVTASDYAECDNCNTCIETNFCTECQYWPIYPCYSATRPMVTILFWTFIMSNQSITKQPWFTIL